MLVLSRKPQEKILIGTDIEITIIAVRGRRVKIGFNCPPETPIYRGEVYERIQKSRSETQELLTDPCSEAV